MPNPLVIIVCSVLAFVLAASADWLEARYVRAVRAWEKGEDPQTRELFRERAARASVAMWLVGCVALLGVVEVGWWILPPEGLGLYVGSKLALR